MCQLRIRRDILAAEVPLRSEESQLHHRFSSPEHQRQEEEPTLHLPVKIRGDSICQGRQESAKNPGKLIKGQHTILHLQVCTLDTSEGVVAQRGLESYRERLDCVSSRRGL